MPSASSQILNLLNPDRCLWIAIGILASCVAYKTQCQFQALKARTRAATKDAPQDEAAYVPSGNNFITLKAIMYSPEARQRLSRSLEAAVSIEVLTALSRSNNPVIRDLVAVIVRQKVASRSYMLYLARCIESRRGFDRITSLMDLRFMIVPHAPPIDPSCGVARFDRYWSPLVLESLRDAYVLEAVVKSLVNTLLSTLYEGQEDPIAVRHTLFLLSVLMQYYKYATEIAIYHSLIEWMRLLRRRRAVEEGLLLWLSPCRGVFAPRGRLAECMQDRMGFNALLIGDFMSRGPGSHDASLTRCIAMILRMPGGRELMVEAALYRSYEWSRDISELDSENEEDEGYEENEEDEEDEEEYEEYEDEG